MGDKAEYEDDSSNLEDVYINQSDGLLSLAESLEKNGREILAETPEDKCDLSNENDILNDKDLPSSLIITGLDLTFFNNPEEKSLLEDVFRLFDSKAEFLYIPSFKRVRVNYTSSFAAAQARIQIHETRLRDQVIHCYFAQTATTETPTSGFLQPPALEKQFLISPPCSPPVGWEPVEEAQPLLNYELIAAIGSLDPGGTHELHRGVDNQPDIILCACEETPVSGPKPMIIQTRCPTK